GRQAEDRSPVGHVGETEAAIAIGVDRRTARKMRRANDDPVLAAFSYWQYLRLSGRADLRVRLLLFLFCVEHIRPELEENEHRTSDKDRRIGADQDADNDG